MRPWLVIPCLPRISSRQLPVMMSTVSDEPSTQVSAHVAEGKWMSALRSRFAPWRPNRRVGKSPSYR